jgi:hypothetical protein
MLSVFPDKLLLAPGLTLIIGIDAIIAVKHLLSPNQMSITLEEEGYRAVIRTV